MGVRGAQPDAVLGVFGMGNGGLELRHLGGGQQPAAEQGLHESGLVLEGGHHRAGGTVTSVDGALPVTALMTGRTAGGVDVKTELD